MLSFIVGTLISKDLDRVEVLTSGGVGYELSIPLGTFEKLPRAGEQVSLHTSLVVREDEWLLYGFATAYERAVFRKVLLAKGVGPSLALGMLSTLSPERLVRAIREKDLPTLQQDGKQYGIPVDWGINSICYRTDLIDVEEESWASLWNPAHSGRIAMTGQMDNMVGAAALALGVANPFVNDPEVMKAVEAKMTEQRALLRFYWNDPTQLTQAMATGEVAIAFAWPSVYKELKAQGVPVKYMRPKEGVMGWAQGMLLMKDRDGDTQKAYDFMDAWIAAETGRWLIENYGYGHANVKSVEGVDPAVLADLLLEDPVATLDSSFFIRDMPSDVQTAYVAMVERIKAGG